MTKKTIFFTLLVSLLFPNLSIAMPNIKAKTSILMDYNSGKILHENEADMSIYPASMTKIMTSIIVFDLLKQGRINLDDEFIISENAWRMSRSGYNVE